MMAACPVNDALTDDTLSLVLCIAANTCNVDFAVGVLPRVCRRWCRILRGVTLKYLGGPAGLFSAAARVFRRIDTFVCTDLSTRCGRDVDATVGPRPPPQIEFGGVLCLDNTAFQRLPAVSQALLERVRELRVSAGFDNGIIDKHVPVQTKLLRAVGPRLTAFHANGWARASLSVLPIAASLASLDLDSCYVHVPDIVPLAPSLLHLRLHECCGMDSTDVRLLGAFTRLKTLRIKLPMCTQSTFNLTVVAADLVAALAGGMPQLEGLSVYSLSDGVGPLLVAVALGSYAPRIRRLLLRLPERSVLRPNFSRVNNDFVPAVARLTELTHFSFADGEGTFCGEVAFVTTQQLRAFCGHQNIRSIRVNVSRDSRPLFMPCDIAQLIHGIVATCPAAGPNTLQINSQFGEHTHGTRFENREHFTLYATKGVKSIDAATPPTMWPTLVSARSLCAHLTTLSIITPHHDSQPPTRQDIDIISLYLSQLRIFNVEASGFDDDCIAIIASKLQHLTHLYMSHLAFSQLRVFGTVVALLPTIHRCAVLGNTGTDFFDNYFTAPPIAADFVYQEGCATAADTGKPFSWTRATTRSCNHAFGTIEIQNNAVSCAPPPLTDSCPCQCYERGRCGCYTLGMWGYGVGRSE